MGVSLRDTALRMVAKREMSVEEFRRKLLKKFPSEKGAIESMVEEFSSQSWLSDERFCEAFIQYQKLTTRSGPLKIRYKLREKGVDDDIIQVKLRECFSEKEQLELVKVLAERKYSEVRKRNPDGDDFQKKQKILQFLVQKGYDFAIAQKGIEE